MAFHDVRLPISIEQGAVGGPEFKTTIQQLASGFEQRNIDWSVARGRWDIGFPIDETNWTDLLDFFYARSGRAHSFRFRDWSDYRVGDHANEIPAQIGLGDGVTVAFQITKDYSSGGTTYSRNITKPVAPVRVFVDSVEQTEGVDFTVVLTTGVITFTGAPSGSPDPVIEVLTEFDVPVRFDIDHLPITMEVAHQLELARISGVDIVEVRDE